MSENVRERIAEGVQFKEGFYAPSAEDAMFMELEESQMEDLESLASVGEAEELEGNNNYKEEINMDIREITKNEVEKLNKKEVVDLVVKAQKEINELEAKPSGDMHIAEENGKLKAEKETIEKRIMETEEQLAKTNKILESFGELVSEKGHTPIMEFNGLAIYDVTVRAYENPTKTKSGKEFYGFADVVLSPDSNFVVGSFRFFRNPDTDEVFGFMPEVGEQEHKGKTYPVYPFKKFVNGAGGIGRRIQLFKELSGKVAEVAYEKWQEGNYVAIKPKEDK